VSRQAPRTAEELRYIAAVVAAFHAAASIGPTTISAAALATGLRLLDGPTGSLSTKAADEAVRAIGLELWHRPHGSG